MTRKLELWGGHECTVNRVGDVFSDQTLLSGHETRIGDLDLFASLGCSALRYPVLWERVSPLDPTVRDWAWSDARLAHVRDLGIRPIVGLVHHGSGPRYTHLLDPDFATGLARHAQAVAERYPWIPDWTPVNEPLTTARFSALYGHWYPHAASQEALWTALLNQIDAVRLSMTAIRRVIPQARLIQTEDLGRTYGTAALDMQVTFDNRRRWLTWDLLTGRVDQDHELFEHLAAFGLADRLKAIADAPCPPDIVGINHYLTSDRFLDDRLALYPTRSHGGNGQTLYADVEAVRVLRPGPDGLEGVLREAHARYGLPLAVTEAHNGCTREEQMRWLLEAWRTSQRLVGQGLDIRAVTAWSLLGSFGWDDLLRAPGGRYEAGVFDLRDGAPRATGVAGMLKALSADQAAPAVAEGAGWWRRDIRFEHRPVDRADMDAPRLQGAVNPFSERPILLIGRGNPLQDALIGACHQRGLACVLSETAAADFEHRLDRDAPWAVIDVAKLSDDPEDLRPLVLVEATGLVERACRARTLPVITLSHGLAGALRPSPYVLANALLDLLIDAPAPSPSAHQPTARERSPV